MARKARKRGRPRKQETLLSKWLDAAGISRDELATRLNVSRPYVDMMCRGGRRPSLELAVAIEELTHGEVPASVWTRIPKHSRD
jgi:transcriptional regulator with XRE-family HTH domain